MEIVVLQPDTSFSGKDEGPLRLQYRNCLSFVSSRAHDLARQGETFF